MFTELLINTTIQWLLFMFVPIIVYLIFFRKKYNLLLFLGLNKPEKIANVLLGKMLIVSIIFILISTYWLQKYNMGIDDIQLLSFKETGLSIQTILIIVIQSVIRTSFLEEIVFRGFLINVLKDKLSFNFVNHIQAIVFAALHIFAMLTFSIIDIIIALVSIYLLSIYLGKSVRDSGYSILYSSLFHGGLNILASIMIILMRGF